jgi:hypothetical protein
MRLAATTRPRPSSGGFVFLGKRVAAPGDHFRRDYLARRDRGFLDTNRWVTLPHGVLRGPRGREPPVSTPDPPTPATPDPPTPAGGVSPPTSPREPLPQPGHAAGAPPGLPPPVWWQREMAVLAVGVFMLALGGLLGYLIGDSGKSNPPAARTRTVVAQAHASQTTVTDHTTVTSGHAKQRTPTTSVPAATRTVTVKQAPHVITQTNTVTVAHTVTMTSTTSTSTSASPGSSTQTFVGSGNQSLGTINASSGSQLQWSCGGCGGSAPFTVTAGSGGGSGQLSVQGGSSTSGQTTVSAGSYPDVNVQGSGSWSLTIAPLG